jgi:hypothetical protein
VTGPLYYPPADRHTQWVGKGSVTMPMNNVKWGVHDTETASWPSYSYGGTSMGSAPTLTYNPWTHEMRQHFEMNQSARAFRNGPNGEYVNRADVIQMEVIGYCDYNLSKKYGHAVSDIDDQAVNELGDFGSWCHTHWGLAFVFYPEALPWPKYPNGVTRMSWSRYQTWSGVLGHMAVPFNSHLDPGDLPMDRIKARMNPQPPKEWTDMATEAEVQAAVEAGVTDVLTTHKFTIDSPKSPGGTVQRTLPTIIYTNEREIDAIRGQLTATQKALANLQATVDALPKG